MLFILSTEVKDMHQNRSKGKILHEFYELYVKKKRTFNVKEIR